MPLTSDLQIDVKKFQPSGISKKTTEFNDGLMKLTANAPKWWEVFCDYYPKTLLHELTCLRLEQRNTDRCEPMARHPYQHP